MCIFDAGDGVQVHRKDGVTGAVVSGECIIQGGAPILDSSTNPWGPGGVGKLHIHPSVLPS